MRLIYRILTTLVILVLLVFIIKDLNTSISGLQSILYKDTSTVEDSPINLFLEKQDTFVSSHRSDNFMTKSYVDKIMALLEDEGLISTRVLKFKEGLWTETMDSSESDGAEYLIRFTDEEELLRSLDKYYLYYEMINLSLEDKTALIRVRFKEVF